MDSSDGNRSNYSRNYVFWFVGSVLAAIIASIVDDLWELLKNGSFTNFFEAVSVEAGGNFFIRTDLVDESKQSLAQLIIIGCGLLCIVAGLLTRENDEGYSGAAVMGLGYGYALAVAVLFLLSYFDRFQDIHLAIGGGTVFLGGCAIFSLFLTGFNSRYLDRKS